jgi:hypothetical protein
MQMIGYNDEFRTLHGELGGFIIKNSWEDLGYRWDPAQHEARGLRGSHSVPYLMNEISSWDERMICANAQNPANWLSCTGFLPGPTGQMDRRLRRLLAQYRQSLPVDAPKTPVDICLNKTFQDHLTNWMRQPNEFTCNHNATYYHCDNATYRYFLDTITYDENDLATAKFVTILKSDNVTNGTFELREVPPSILAEAFQPIEGQLKNLSNSLDLCGYYFMCAPSPSLPPFNASLVLVPSLSLRSVLLTTHPPSPPPPPPL